MATKTVRVSDKSGRELGEGAGYEVKFVPVDGRRKAFVMDVTDDEATAMMGDSARETVRRGRRPKAS